MATIVTYGDLIFNRVLSEDVTAEAVRDSDSQTDTWFNRFTVVFSSVVNITTFNAVGGIGVTSKKNVVVADVAIAEAYVLSQLRDRQPWSYQKDGFDILLVPGGGGSVDCNNGPRILWNKITKLTPQTFGIRVALQVCLSPCYGPSGPGSGPPAILGNRWSQLDDYEELYRCTRTYRGRMRLSTANVSPQTFRSTVLPPLSRGFKRKRMSFEASENGLELAYTVTDEEMLGEAPPLGAVKMQGTHSESFGVSGAESEGIVSVRLDAPKGVSKDNLLNAALQVALAKLRLQIGNGNGTDNSTTLMSAQLINHFSDNENAVEVVITAKHVNSPATAGGDSYFGNVSVNYVTIPLANLSLPNYDPNVIVVRDAYGNAGPAGALACALQTPCSDHSFPGTTTANQASQQSAAQTADTDNPVQITVGTGTLGISTTPPSYSSQHQSAPYHISQIDLTYEKSFNSLQLPIAASQAASGGDQGPQKTSVVVILGPPTCRLRVHVVMERVGQSPEMWIDKNFESHGTTFTLLSYVPRVRAPVTMGNQTQQVFAMEAEYVFAMDIPPAPGATLSASSLPWTTATVSSDALPNSAYIEPTDPNFGLA